MTVPSVSSTAGPSISPCVKDRDYWSMIIRRYKPPLNPWIILLPCLSHPIPSRRRFMPSSRFFFVQSNFPSVPSTEIEMCFLLVHWSSHTHNALKKPYNTFGYVPIITFAFLIIIARVPENSEERSRRARPAVSDKRCQKRKLIGHCIIGESGLNSTR